MSVSEVLGGLGKWDVTLSPELPEEVRAQLGAFGHIVIVRGDLGADPTSYGDTLLRSARYVGLCYDVGKGDDRTLGGVSLEAWLGDEDKKGAVFETPVSLTNATLSAWLTAVLPSAVTLGTVHPLTDPSLRLTDKIQWLSPREAVDRICKAFGVEYVVRFDGTLDAGRQDQLYRALPRTDGTPAPMVRRREGGTDLDAVALGGALQAESSAKDFSTRIVLVGETDDQTGQFAISSGSLPTLSIPFFDLHGNRIVRTRLISSSQETTTTGPATVALNLNRFGRLTTSLKITADGYELEGTFAVGDLCYVYDPDTGLIDPAREVLFRGVPIHPQIIRISEIGWSVTSDHTVLFRTTGGVWVDLTRWVVWESGSNDLTVGDLPRTLTSGGANPVLDRADANTGRGDVPAAPTGLSLTTDAFTDPKTGANSAVVRATWTAPTTNTDSTLLLDLALYRVQWRPTFRAPQWNETSTVGTTIDLPAVTGLGYDVRVAAVDKSGNVGAFTSIASITAAADPTAPPAPADPVTTNYIGQIRVVWSGKDSLGNQMPPDTNRIVVERSIVSSSGPWVEVDYLTPFAAGISYVAAAYGTSYWIRLRAYDHAGNVGPASGVVTGVGQQVGTVDYANLSITNAKIADLAVGKLTAGVMTADVTISGRFATALTGARREINATGFQAWDASNNLTISLDGVDNLLTGRLKTALSGRRIEVGSTGLLGEIHFYAPDGTDSFVRAFTESTGLEAIQFGVATGGGGGGSLWNRINYNTEEYANYRARIHEFMFQGSNASGASDGYFHLIEYSLQTGATQERFRIDKGGSTDFYRDVGSSTEWSIWERSGGTTYRRIRMTDLDVQFIWFRTDQGNTVLQAAQDGTRATRVQLVTPNNWGVTYSHRSNADGSSARAEIKDVNNSVFQDVWGAAYSNASSRAGKTDIAAVTFSSRERLRLVQPRTFRRQGQTGIGPDGTETQGPDGPTELGLIAEEAPEEIVTRDETGAIFGINLPATDAMLLGYCRELDDRIDALQALVETIRRGPLP